MHTRSLGFLALVGLSSWLTGCGEPGGTGTVQLQFATRSPASAPIQSQPGTVAISLGADQIVVDRVQVVLRKIRLDGAATATCSEDEDSPGCAEFRRGPEVFELPLDAGADAVFTASVPAGTYSAVRLQIHKPSNANGDAALVAEHPELENTSIRVTGTYNGEAFTYTSDLTREEHVSLVAPLEVLEGGSLDVTLYFDLASWFANAEGTGLIDPRQAVNGEAYESQVEQNIRASFKAFEDDDQDGESD